MACVVYATLCTWVDLPTFWEQIEGYIDAQKAVFLVACHSFSPLTFPENFEKASVI